MHLLMIFQCGYQLDIDHLFFSILINFIAKSNKYGY